MRINLLGGPGVGKSTTAAWLFSELKVRGYSVELVNEYAKAYAVQKRKIGKWDQCYLFGKQMQYEYRFLSNGIKNIITDCPTLLSSMYAKLYIPDSNMWKSLLYMSREYDMDHPSTNILLRRKDLHYMEEGRYQTHDEAKKVDESILDFLRGNKIMYREVACTDRYAMLGLTLNLLEK